MSLIQRSWTAPSGNMWQMNDHAAIELTDLNIRDRPVKSLDGIFSHEDVNQEILSFLRPTEVALIVTRVCRYFKRTVDLEATWQRQGEIQGFPERLPEGMTYKRVIKDLYPSMFGKDFYSDYFGEAGKVPRMPPHFIEMAYLPEPLAEAQLGERVKDKYQLVLRPENIANTINNIGQIGRKHRKKGRGVCFSDGSSKDIFRQHGNTLSPAGWSFQRKYPVAQGEPYPQQRAYIEQAGLEVVSLIDRALYGVLQQISKPKKASYYCDWTARCSTVTLKDGPKQSIVWNAVDLGIVHLTIEDWSPGVAVGIPLIQRR